MKEPIRRSTGRTDTMNDIVMYLKAKGNKVTQEGKGNKTVFTINDSELKLVYDEFNRVDLINSDTKSRYVMMRSGPSAVSMIKEYHPELLKESFIYGKVGE